MIVMACNVIVYTFQKAVFWDYRATNNVFLMVSQIHSIRRKRGRPASTTRSVSRPAGCVSGSGQEQWQWLTWLDHKQISYNMLCELLTALTWESLCEVKCSWLQVKVKINWELSSILWIIPSRIEKHFGNIISIAWRGNYLGGRNCTSASKVWLLMPEDGCHCAY